MTQVVRKEAEIINSVSKIAPESDLEQAPSRVEEIEECMICIENFEPDTVLIKTSCNHVFHV